MVWYMPLVDPKNRPTASTFVYNRRGPVVFTYTDLNPTARYRTRFTLVGPRPRSQTAQSTGAGRRNVKRTESILADSAVLARDLEIPAYTARQFEFDIPEESTRDGKLELRFERPANAEPNAAAVVSEVWIIKR